MKTILILAMFLVPVQIQQLRIKTSAPVKPSPEVQKVLKQIAKNSPKLDKEYQQSLAQTIIKKSKKYGISSKVLAAMLMQESSYKLSAKNVRCGISVITGEKDCIAVDFGIGQINYKTIKHFKFDQKKLLSNLEYSVEAAAIVLADFKKMYGHKESNWWTRYNSSSKHHREKYQMLVARYM